jgi:hypothetical protein
MLWSWLWNMLTTDHWMEYRYKGRRSCAEMVPAVLITVIIIEDDMLLTSGNERENVVAQCLHQRFLHTSLVRN